MPSGMSNPYKWYEFISRSRALCGVFFYVGRPINSDNGLISQKLLLKSKFYYPLHVAMGVAYSCLRYEVFIII